MKILLRWPHCNADYPGPQPRPVVLDTNVVLDLLVFDDPLVPPIRQLLAQGQLRWIADDAQRVAAYRKFVRTIRSKYPKAYIICALGSMDAVRPGSKWPGYVRTAVEQMQK